MDTDNSSNSRCRVNNTIGMRLASGGSQVDDSRLMLQHKEIERQWVVKGEGTLLYLFTCAGLYLDVKLIHTKD